MTIDYKALAERIDRISLGIYLTERERDDLRTVVSLLEGMAEERPVAWMRPDNRVREESFTGKQFSRGEQRPPIGTWNPLYLHTAPQPQPKRQPISEPIHGYGDYGAKILVNGEPTQMSRGMQRLWDHPLNDIVMQ